MKLVISYNKEVKKVMMAIDGADEKELTFEELLIITNNVIDNNENYDLELIGFEEKDFNDLDRGEQLQILASNELDDDYGLTDSEIELINTMRRNNWSMADYNSYVANQAIKSYTNQNQENQYSVDDFSACVEKALNADFTEMTEKEKIYLAENYSVERVYKDIV